MLVDHLATRAMAEGDVPMYRETTITPYILQVYGGSVHVPDMLPLVPERDRSRRVGRPALMQQQLAAASCLMFGPSWPRVAAGSPGGVGGAQVRRRSAVTASEVGLGHGVEARRVWVTSCGCRLKWWRQGGERS
uniref:Uncharacterized protein n=1 Tax=Ananas comosus var. bracteatus TaxID=296719 RepID=A0A6V7PEB1_ANACO|nr:unnamed protein product [Ananas comosus var. bracteatus]